MMPFTLYVATSNPGKLRDFVVAARAYGDRVELVPLPGLAQMAAPPEDASTFEGNARSKAIAYSQHASGWVVLADDSGLEVDALGGAPGVHSARYATIAEYIPASPRSLSTDERNNMLLLKNLGDTQETKRSARYRCVLAAARDGKCIAAAEGVVEGMILETSRGHGGFGYDPLFYLPELGRTMAEIGLEQKLQLSHRGKALRALLGKLSI